MSEVTTRCNCQIPALLGLILCQIRFFSTFETTAKRLTFTSNEEQRWAFPTLSRTRQWSGRRSSSCRALRRRRWRRRCAAWAPPSSRPASRPPLSRRRAPCSTPTRSRRPPSAAAAATSSSRTPSAAKCPPRPLSKSPSSRPRWTHNLHRRPNPSHQASRLIWSRRWVGVTDNPMTFFVKETLSCWCLPLDCLCVDHYHTFTVTIPFKPKVKIFFG